MHDQHARATALDGVVPRQITLQNGIPVFVRDDLRLHCGMGHIGPCQYGCDQSENLHGDLLKTLGLLGDYGEL